MNPNAEIVLIRFLSALWSMPANCSDLLVKLSEAKERPGTRSLPNISLHEEKLGS